jgi:hypothetical protein
MGAIVIRTRFGEGTESAEVATSGFNYTYNILINEFITNLAVEKKVRNVSLYICTPVRNVPI